MDTVGPRNQASQEREFRYADVVILGIHAITLERRRPTAEAIATCGARIVAVGAYDEIRTWIGPETTVLDGAGGIAIPAFHDAHCHFLSYARSRSWVDCRGAHSIAEIARALKQSATAAPAPGWLRAYGFDDLALSDKRQPDRRDLDAAVSDRPVRLQHRTLHLDVLNGLALRELGLAELHDSRIERDPVNDECTGRIYHGGELLYRGQTRGSGEQLAVDVQAACDRLLGRGITSVQDASVTNGSNEWELFHRLAAYGDLRLRLFMMWGGEHWRERAGARHARDLVRHGPVKLMIEEGTTDPSELRVAVGAAARAGYPVALHAVSEAEVAIALDVLRDAPCSRRGPHRIEHGSVICDDCLSELRALHVMVVGQPALIAERGDVYRQAYPSETHGWLHRAGSLLRSGIGYAAGSDAPVTEPDPLFGIAAARIRRTRAGSILGSEEKLGLEEAIIAFALGPAQAVGAQRYLGRLRPGARADIAICDPESLESPSLEVGRTVRATIMNGAVAWQRG